MSGKTTSCSPYSIKWTRATFHSVIFLQYSAQSNPCAVHQKGIAHPNHSFHWTPLSSVARSLGSRASRADPCTRLGGRGCAWDWEENHMDYVWIRVVTPEWEYTERVE